MASKLDDSLILALERTLFSAQQNGWTVVFIGIGLMMTGAANNKLPDAFGAAIIIAGVLFIFLSWIMHIIRMRAVSNGHPLTIAESAFWTGALTLLLVVAISIELHYAFMYPYLMRTKAVELV